MILFNSLIRKLAKLKNTHYRTGILKNEYVNEMEVNLAYYSEERSTKPLLDRTEFAGGSYFALLSIIYNLQSCEVPQRQ